MCVCVFCAWQTEPQILISMMVRMADWPWRCCPDAANCLACQQELPPGTSAGTPLGGAATLSASHLSTFLSLSPRCLSHPILYPHPSISLSLLHSLFPFLLLSLLHPTLLLTSPFTVFLLLSNPHFSHSSLLLLLSTCISQHLTPPH